MFSIIRLGNKEVIHIHANATGIGRVHSVLSIDEGGLSPLFLGFGDNMKSQCRLPRCLRSENLDNPTTREASDSQAQVERDRPRRNGCDLDSSALLAHFHDGAFSELFLYLRKGRFDRPIPRSLFFIFIFGHFILLMSCHNPPIKSIVYSL